MQSCRRNLNAGLALHGLSTNCDAFLPVSIDGAYAAFRSSVLDRGSYVNDTSSNRVLFEGSAAISLALEASTLFYRLNRHHSQPSSHSSGGNARHRDRIGIQSGFFQGYSGNAASDEFDNEPYASAPSLTYHEFLACARPSSDRRRSILELDALLRPISYPSVPGGSGASSGMNVSALLSGANGSGALSSSVLAALASSGLIGGSSANAPLGELQKRLIMGTSI